MMRIQRVRGLLGVVMKKPGWVLYACLIVLACASHDASAGPWALGRGGNRVELWTNRWQDTHRFNARGDKVRNSNAGRFQRTYSVLKTEHSLSQLHTRLDGVDLLLSGEFTYLARWEQEMWAISRSRRDVGGDFRAGIRWNPLEYPVVLSFHFQVKIPGRYETSREPPVGTGHPDLEPARLLLGRSFCLPSAGNGVGSKGHPSLLSGYLAGWCAAEVAYQFRDGKPSDAVPYVAEVGLALSKRLAWKASLDGEEGHGGRAGDEERDYTKWMSSLIIDLGGIGVLAEQRRAQITTSTVTLELGVARTFRGNNASVGDEAFCALAIRW